ncbi:MAG: VTC domain-containing protein [Bacteriovoracaceae bacterium]
MNLVKSNTNSVGAELKVDQFKNNSSGEFNRIEDKYLVKMDDLNTVLKSLYTHMDPSYLDDVTQFTLIESLYFDSDNLDFYKHHFMDLTKRYKLRTRRYAPNGIWSTEASASRIKS